MNELFQNKKEGMRIMKRGPSGRWLSGSSLCQKSRICFTPLFSRGVIFTRSRVSLALLSLRKNGGLLVVYSDLSFLTYEFGLESLLVKVK